MNYTRMAFVVAWFVAATVPSVATGEAQPVDVEPFAGRASIEYFVDDDADRQGHEQPQYDYGCPRECLAWEATIVEPIEPVADETPRPGLASHMVAYHDDPISGDVPGDVSPQSDSPDESLAATHDDSVYGDAYEEHPYGWDCYVQEAYECELAELELADAASPDEPVHPAAAVAWLTDRLQALRETAAGLECLLRDRTGGSLIELARVSSPVAVLAVLPYVSEIETPIPEQQCPLDEGDLWRVSDNEHHPSDFDWPFAEAARLEEMLR